MYLTRTGFGVCKLNKHDFYIPSYTNISITSADMLRPARCAFLLRNTVFITERRAAEQSRASAGALALLAGALAVPAWLATLGALVALEPALGGLWGWPRGRAAAKAVELSVVAAVFGQLLVVLADCMAHTSVSTNAPPLFQHARECEG